MLGSFLRNPPYPQPDEALLNKKLAEVATKHVAQFALNQRKEKQEVALVKNWKYCFVSHNDMPYACTSLPPVSLLDSRSDGQLCHS